MSVEDTQPLITHLIELRKRLLNCIIAVIVIFLCLVYFANDIYHLVSAPLIKQLPQGSTMIATDVASPFFTPIKLTFMVSLILSAPVILYQVWAFIAPALYKHERRLVVPLLVSSSLLFYIGMAFAYFVVFPLAFGFLANTAPEGVQVSTDIASYLSFVMALFMAFGVSFEVPVAIVLLCWMGITSPEDLRKKRPYVLVGAFVVGMLLTPPDVFSQTLLAIPMYCLFEIGVFFARFYTGKRLTRDEDAAAEGASQAVGDADQIAFGIWRGDEFIGILFHWGADGYRYVEHLAVSPALRGQNMGSAALSAFCRKVGRVILEIDPPVDDISIRRLHFYERLGFVANPYRYIHPSFRKPFTPHRLVLMSYPGAITYEEARSFADFVREAVLRYSEHEAPTLPNLA